MTDEFPEPKQEVENIKPEELRNKIENGEELILLDVRATEEHEAWSINPGKGKTLNEPYFNLLDGINSDLLNQLDGEKEIVVICAKGGSSEYIASLIKEELDKNVKSLAEGMNGWAKIYETHKLELENGELIQYHRPSSGCLGYMIRSNGENAVIDPLRAFTDRYTADLQDSKLKYALDTHVHADHISGARELGKREETTTVIPEAARGRSITYIDEVKTIEDGEKLDVGQIEIKAIHTPGHTTGMTSYLVDDEVILTGDGLFIESVARPDLEKGSEGAEKQAEQLYNSLHDKILTLPEDVLVGAAHLSNNAKIQENGLYMKTIGQLKQDLELLSYNKEDFIEYILSDMPPRPANYEDIIPTNKGEKDASDEEAFKMELGPNNCAATK